MMTGVYMIIELPIVERKILMSVVIIGGNECMVCKYKSLCKEYQCKKIGRAHV